MDRLWISLINLGVDDIDALLDYSSLLRVT